MMRQESRETVCLDIESLQATVDNQKKVIETNRAKITHIIDGKIDMFKYHSSARKLQIDTAKEKLISLREKIDMEASYCREALDILSDKLKNSREQINNNVFKEKVSEIKSVIEKISPRVADFKPNRYRIICDGILKAFNYYNTQSFFNLPVLKVELVKTVKSKVSPALNLIEDTELCLENTFNHMLEKNLAERELKIKEAV